jgi:class 3 adenylate cyclase
MPSVADDPVIRRWWAKFLRMSASASAAAALQKLNIEIDIRHVLPSIRVPTLVLHAKHDRAVPLAAGRYMADRIANARFVEIDSIDHLPYYDKPDDYIRHIQTFVTGDAAPGLSETRVSTLMFTDIVGATQMAVAKGDVRFGDLLEVHHAAVRHELARFRGEEINTAGDGFLAAFDGPARAIQCGMAIIASLAALGIDSRIGLHTGECEVRHGGLQGIALHIAARVAALAPPGGVFVSRTVRDLVAGSGIRFSEGGVQTLKGVPDQWQLYQVADPANIGATAT